VLVTVLLLLGLLLLVIPPAIILAAFGADLTGFKPGSMPVLPEGAGLWLGLYLLVLIPLVLWLFARLALLMPSVVGDRLALGAFRRSWQLTRGMALKIVGVILLYAVVSTVANLAVTSAFGAIMYLVAGSEGEGLSLASVLTTVVAGAVTTGFTVLGTAFAAKLYVAAVGRAEAAFE
jgi:membrane-anchored glycerophosphoryl diester phosphodiesterase (GDPDase)